jgi:predicted dehydrogenase
VDGDGAMVWAGLVSTITLPTVESVRWRIIGVGNVTEAKSGPGFQQAERSELVAVMRRNGDLAADYARRHDVPRWYGDADELVNDPEVDTVTSQRHLTQIGSTWSASRRQASGGRYPAEDLVTGVFSFRSGVEGVGVWNYDSFQHKDQVEIIGTAGALRFSCFDDDPLRLLTARGVEQIKAPYPETVQLPLIQTVVNALTGHGESPGNGHSALRTARVIDDLLLDYRDSHGINYSPAKPGRGVR